MRKQKILNKCTDTAVLVNHYGTAISGMGTKDQREYASVLTNSMLQYISNIKAHIDNDCKKTRKQELTLLDLEMDALRTLYHSVMKENNHG